MYGKCDKQNLLGDGGVGGVMGVGEEESGSVFVLIT